MKELSQKDLQKLSCAYGTIRKHRNNQFDFCFIKNNTSNFWIIIFDPKTQGTSLTNCAEEIITQVLDLLILSKAISFDDLVPLLSKGQIILRDTNDTYCQVSLAYKLNSSDLKDMEFSPSKSSKQNTIYLKEGKETKPFRTDSSLDLLYDDSLKITKWTDFSFTPKVLELMKLLA